MGANFYYSVLLSIIIAVFVTVWLRWKYLLRLSQSTSPEPNHMDRASVREAISSIRFPLSKSDGEFVKPPSAQLPFDVAELAPEDVSTREEREDMIRSAAIHGVPALFSDDTIKAWPLYEPDLWKLAEEYPVLRGVLLKEGPGSIVSILKDEAESIIGLGNEVVHAGSQNLPLALKALLDGRSMKDDGGKGSTSSPPSPSLDTDGATGTRSDLYEEATTIDADFFEDIDKNLGLTDDEYSEITFLLDTQLTADFLNNTRNEFVRLMTAQLYEDVAPGATLEENAATTGDTVGSYRDYMILDSRAQDLDINVTNTPPKWWMAHPGVSTRARTSAYHTVQVILSGHGMVTLFPPSLSSVLHPFPHASLFGSQVRRILL